MIYCLTMKKDTHPNYQPIIFHDVTCNKSFLLSSTLAPKETMKYEDGKEYPVYKVETSSESHPFYTGKQKIVDTAGRVDNFNRRFGSLGKKSADSEGKKK